MDRGSHGTELRSKIQIGRGVVRRIPAEYHQRVDLSRIDIRC